MRTSSGWIGRTALMAALLSGGGLGGVAAQQAPDSVAHPIATNCGERLDPVGFVLRRGEEVGVTADERGKLEALAARVADENRPLGQRFWAARGSGGQEERRAVLFELRANYRAALRDVRALLGDARYQAAFRVSPQGEEAGTVRCLARAIPTVLGNEPR